MAVGRYQSIVFRRVGAEQALHTVGGVGADHQQFAVRHVDDAHHAVGDGQTERGEQQDAAERQAGKDAAEVFGHRQPAVDGFDGGNRLVAHLVVGLCGLDGERQQRCLDRRRGAASQRLDCVQTYRRVATTQGGLGVGEGQQPLDLGVGFLVQRLLEQGGHIRADLALYFAGRGQANFAVGVEQFECCQGTAQLSPDSVIDQDAFEVGRHLDGLAGDRIKGLVAGDDHCLVTGQKQAVFRHRSQDAHGIRVGILGDLANRRHLVAGTLGSQLAHQFRVECRPGREASETEQ